MYFATKPPKRSHSLGDAFLVGRNDFAQILGVHTGGHCRRADEVREHDRDLAALGGVRGTLWLRSNAAAAAATTGPPFSASFELGNRPQHLPPITEDRTPRSSPSPDRSESPRTERSMRFSAKRSAYSDMPSALSQSAICCIAATNRISHCLRFWIVGTQSLSHPLLD
jgi:hypothetical protein